MTDKSESNDSKSEATDVNKTTEVATTSAQPIIVKVHGKEFNVADPIQKAQLEAWDEAHAKLIGRQTNELGALRQFKKERTPSATEADLVAKAKAKAQEGDLDAAFDSVFSYAKESVAKADARLAAERVNSELWEEYFSTRPELANSLGRKRIKTIAESSLEIFDENKDPFQVLDDFFKPLVRSEKPASAKPTVDEKPPVTVSGASAPQKSDASKAAPKGLSIDEVLGSHTVYRTK